MARWRWVIGCGLLSAVISSTPVLAQSEAPSDPGPDSSRQQAAAAPTGDPGAEPPTKPESSPSFVQRLLPDKSSDSSEKEKEEEKEPASPDAEAGPTTEVERESKPAGSPQGSPTPAGNRPPADAATSEESELVGLDPGDLIARAAHVEQELSAFEPQLTVPPRLSDLRRTLREREPRIRETTERAREEIARDAGWFLLADLRFELAQERRQLDGLSAPMDAFRTKVASIDQSVETISREWSRAKSSLQEVGAAAPVQQAVARVLQKIHLVKFRLRRAQSDVALTSAQTERLRTMLDEVIALTHTGGPGLIRDFGHRMPPPWTRPAPGAKDVLTAVLEAYEKALQNAGLFLKSSLGGILFQLAVFVGLWLYARRGRSPEIPRTSFVEVGLIFRRPLSSSALVALLFTIVLYSAAPASISLLVLCACVAAACSLLMDEDTPQRRAFSIGAIVLTLFPPIHVALSRVPDLRVWVFGAEGLLVLFFALRISGFRAEQWGVGWGRALSILSRAWIAFSALGLVLWAAGFDISSSILIDASARVMLLTVVFRVAYDVMTSFVRSLVQTDMAQTSRMLRLKGPIVVDRFSLLLRWALLLEWLSVALGTYRLRPRVMDGLTELVEQKLEVGSLSVTVGDVLALGIGIFLAIYASRFVRFLLSEEVLPRMGISVGSSAAVTSGAGYLVLGVGLFMALAAVGFELDKITILVSALGVGIGFGLQNIVQNFVAGLILIFGRPINVGDQVEVGGLLGTVTEVGFRASVVKTFQGAEVIVPNSQFVSDQVINWSLSDEHRRIELDVGVKYGTDPERVLEILDRAAKDHPEVMADPAPDPLFMGFGDSSLNFQLRCWTANGSGWLKVRSDLSVAINRLLAEADIEIPFPQRDLNIRTLDDAVLAKLGRSGRKVPSSES